MSDGLDHEATTQVVVGPDKFDAVLFDMDGVLTTTARMHASAWKRTFDEFLQAWDTVHGTDTWRFSIADDYVATVDGKPREDGVRDFSCLEVSCCRWGRKRIP